MSTQMRQFPTGGQQQAPQQQAQQPHPTVPYGQAGVPLGTVIPANQPFPGQQQAAPAGQAPQFFGQGYDVANLPPAPQQPNYGQQQQQQAWQAGFQPQGVPFNQQPAQPAPQAAPPAPAPQQAPWQPQQPAQPQSQPQYQQPAQQGGIDLNTRLDGQGVPQELRGRTLGQALQMYSGLTQAWLRSQSQQPQMQQQTQQPQIPQQRQQPQGQTPGFWDDARQIMREEIHQALGPVQQFTNQQVITQAQSWARQNIPDFGTLEADVLQSLTGASPEILSNSEVWASAADLARGKAIREGRYQPQQQVQHQQPQQQQRSVPAGMQPLPQYTFFAEGPTPPTAGNGANGQFGLTPQQMWAAQAMGMSPESYTAWLGGVQVQR